ncbi:MAG: glycosyltransferase family 4 protein [bacterium]|nr:glycosyltransferase family 4 protein [bacterium]
MRVSILTGGGGDRYYELGLARGLADQGIFVELVGGDSLLEREYFSRDNARIVNLRGSQKKGVSRVEKVLRVFRYYFRLIVYAWQTDATVFHIQWLNKFELFDSSLLMIYYKLLGKKLLFTAHNVDAMERVGKRSLVNRISLKFLYTLSDHIIVHTEKMKKKMGRWYGVPEEKISVVSYGINDMVPKTDLTSAEARRKLGIDEDDKVVLFFGNITLYKGYEYLLEAFAGLADKDKKEVLLLVAGRIMTEEAHRSQIEKIIQEKGISGRMMTRHQFIPDEDIEVYFKAADILVLPYKNIFQSGVLFLSYSFGLPVIVSDVGSLRDHVSVGETGYVVPPRDPEALKEQIEIYFGSDLYKGLSINRGKIEKYAFDTYSWDKIGVITGAIYSELLDQRSEE